MPKKFINFIFGRKEDEKTQKNEVVFSSEKDKNLTTKKNRKAKDKEVAEIISTRFGRALERLGER